MATNSIYKGKKYNSNKENLYSSFLDSDTDNNLYYDESLFSNDSNMDLLAFSGPRKKRIQKLEKEIENLKQQQQQQGQQQQQSPGFGANSSATTAVRKQYWSNYSNLSPATINFCATATALADIKYCEQLKSREDTLKQIAASSEKNKRKTRAASITNTLFNAAGALASLFHKRMPGPQDPFVRNTGFDYAIQNTKNAETAYKETLFANLYNYNEKIKQYGTTGQVSNLLAANNQVLNSLNKGLPAFANQLASLLKEQGADKANVANKNATVDYNYRNAVVEANLQRTHDVLRYIGQEVENQSNTATSLHNIDTTESQLRSIATMYPQGMISKLGGRRKLMKLNNPMFTEYNRYG